MKHRIAIRDGRAEFIDDDALIPLAGRLGKITRKRASYVEPDNESGGWYADMAPSGGPMLRGFTTHAEAIAAEKAWLQENRGL